MKPNNNINNNNNMSNNSSSNFRTPLPNDKLLRLSSESQNQITTTT